MESYNAGNAHLCLVTDDMDADFARLRAAGYDTFRSAAPDRHPVGTVPRRPRLLPARPGRISIELLEEPRRAGRTGRAMRERARSKVARVEAFPVRYPEPNNDGKIRSLTLVRIETDDGSTGWGEAITGAQEASLAVKLIVERRLAPLLLDQDPPDVAAALESDARRDLLGRQRGHRDVRDLGARHGALGPQGPDRGPLAHGHARRPNARPAACLRQHDLPHRRPRPGRRASSPASASQGYRFVKGGWGHDLDIAFGRDEARDLAIARTVREAIGPDVDMIFDVVALAGWTADHAIRMARQLDDDVRALLARGPAARAGSRRLPRAARGGRRPGSAPGEKGWTGDHYGRLIDSGALDVIMVDPGKAEGVTGTWNVIRAAAAAGRDWNAHSWSSALNTAASLHLAAASDNVLLMELKPLPSPMQHELVRDPIEQRDGWVVPPDGPGLGVEVDEAVVRRYLFS